MIERADLNAHVIPCTMPFNTGGTGETWGRQATMRATMAMFTTITIQHGDLLGRYW